MKNEENNINVELVQYDEKYAKAIAEMWNNSKEGWNGEDWSSTAQSVKESENNSAYIQLTLAKVKEVITGYCKLTIDHFEQDTLYIDLLNVRDDYHGLKIGKKLVLDAVYKTIEMNYPRLDLFTWPGNLKAVPLYKKTGFFWEKRDNTCHLINLIPTVLQTELFQDYFKKADWYSDSTRPIEVKPDSRLENKFDYWTYSWEKDGEMLLVEFNRRGRGIRKIETNDYVITATVEDLNLVFGQSYEVSYEIINKSGKELEINLEGQKDKNIFFDCHFCKRVTHTEVIKAKFKVGSIDKEQSEWKTHPCVKALIKVNGKSVLLKNGIVPKFPLSASLVVPQSICREGFESECFLDVENQFKTKAEFNIKIKDNKDVSFISELEKVVLKPSGKRSIPVNFVVRKSSFYAEELEVIVLVNNTEVNFKVEVSNFFRLGYGTYAGEDKFYLMAGNGNSYLRYYKERPNCINFGDPVVSKVFSYLKPPRLGLPLSTEFEHQLYDKYEIIEENGNIKVKFHYSSRDFKGIFFIRSFVIKPNGVMERWYEVTNNAGSDSKDLLISDSMYFDKKYLTLSYDNQFLEMKEDDFEGLSFYDTSKFTENWIMADCNFGTIGISWDKEHEFKIVDGAVTLISKLGKLKASESIITKPIVTAVNSFADWHLFREFVLGKKLERENTIPIHQFKINNGNPFTTNVYHAEFRSNRTKKLSGKIFYKTDRDLADIAQKEFNEVEAVSFSGKSIKPVVVSELNFKKEGYQKSYQKAVFAKEDKEVGYTEEGSVLAVNNGIIELKVDKDFAPSIFSLKYNGEEWLDTHYPKISSKSWWNPWVGGLFGFPDEISQESIFEENFSVDFVSKTDSLGNKWQGFRITVDFKKKEEKKNMSFSQFYLLLPGVPVLVAFCDIIKDGEYTKDQEIIFQAFMKAKESLKNHRYTYHNKYNLKMVNNPGETYQEFRAVNDLTLEDKDRRESIATFCNDKDIKGFYGDLEMSELWFVNFYSGKSGETMKTKPNFMIFSEEKLTKEMLSDLNNVRFN